MKSERLFKEVMSRILANGSVEQDDNKIIEMSLKLSQVYAMWGDHEKASAGFRFCVDTQERKVAAAGANADEDTVALWGMSSDHLAQYLLALGKHRAALEQFRAAHETCRKLVGDSHPQTLVLLNSIGTVASVMDDNVAAVKHFERAATVARREGDENAATYKVNLGVARIKLGATDAAGSDCREALAMAEAAGTAEVAAEAAECVRLAREAAAAAAAKVKSKSSASSQSSESG